MYAPEPAGPAAPPPDDQPPAGPPSGGRLAALRPRLPSPLEEIADDRLAARGVRLLLKRDDLIHPALPGNKWRKLAPNLEGRAAGSPAGDGRPLLTFGGAYSNHLRATAAAGRLLGIRTIGVVRGAELADRPLNGSLARAAADGMRLHFVPRATYRRRADPAYHAELRADFGDFQLIPEGGSNAAAVRGCAALGRELAGAAQTAVVACGTGGTLAGLAAGLPAGARAIGIPVLKGGFLGADVERLQTAAFGGRRGDWHLADGFHFGGFARRTPELDAFAADFAARHDLVPEPVYVAKMLYAVVALAAEGVFPRGSAVAAVVTG
ncbi:1-aminocyclopropane-1-carboxylate deaminase [Streptomyces sp. WAC 06738]|uniref:1-aminocyclopropane-1-carboxylate deaminase/D-cysteine desulfhydrase n=1 Tax=Streptomyces sp. WAC 06738 TaxID=2203210 RepID=UPI000F6CEE1C|nr:pyridoxal-phosphate dependent enzyme [Streptomyces sp. WAC 06738]AZM48562.1 1-aminocyclopropane-1-carboxylate deaminase [Streptomyces sp. WAC 06738]